MAVKVDTIQNPSSATVNLTLDTSGNVTTGANQTVTGNQTVSGNQTVTGNNNVTGNLSVTGTSTFNNVPSFPSSMMFRNRIINGDMRIDQRNAGASISSGVGGLAYPCDRMFVYATGAAVTAQRTGTAGAYSLTMTGAASNTFCSFGQRIEAQNIADMAGGAVTISAVLSASTPQTVQWAATVPTAADNYASTATIATGTFSVTSTPTLFTATIAAGSTSTIVRGMQVQFAANNGGAFTSGTVVLSNFQVEPGSVVTPFERRLYGQELTLCQRYYYRNTAPSTGTFLTTFGVSQSTTSAIIMTQFPVTMRAAPSALEQSGTAAHYQVFASSNVACSAVPTFLAATVWYATTTATTASGLGSNLPCWLSAANTAAYLGWSAEL